MGFYQRHYLAVVFEPHEVFCGFKSARLAQVLAQGEEAEDISEVQ